MTVYYTAKDIEELAAKGVQQLQIGPGITLTDFARESAQQLGIELVDSRKQGRWMYYRLAGDEVPELVTEGLNWVLSSLAESPKTLEDEKQLEEILKIDPEILCSRQARSET